VGSSRRRSTWRPSSGSCASPTDAVGSRCSGPIRGAAGTVIFSAAPLQGGGFLYVVLTDESRATLLRSVQTSTTLALVLWGGGIGLAVVMSVGAAAFTPDPAPASLARRGAPLRSRSRASFAHREQDRRGTRSTSSRAASRRWAVASAPRSTRSPAPTEPPRAGHERLARPPHAPDGPAGIARGGGARQLPQRSAPGRGEAREHVTSRSPGAAPSGSAA
jgi:hypothetical protein